jgi:hypothetical protein
MTEPEHIGAIVRRVVRKMSKKLSDALDDLAEAWDPEIGILEAATDPVGFVDAVAAELRDNQAEIARLRDLLFAAASCTPERDRRGFCQRRSHDLDAMWRCQFWKDGHCDVDGWEPPE